MTSTTLLTIAGFDPSSGAGITADLAVFAAHGFFATSSITALTVQSTVGVFETHAVADSILAATLDCLDQDLPAAGIKIGMLATAGNVLATANFLKRRTGRGPVVLDPILVSSSGYELLSPAGIEAMCHDLLPLVDWITPNRAELARLLDRPLGTSGEIEAGARELTDRFRSLNVVVTGGDSDPSADFVRTTSGHERWLSGTHIESRSTHGTGCAFSSSLLCRLVDSPKSEPIDAVIAAKEYVVDAIRTATPRGSGRGPMNLLSPCTDR